MGLFAGTPWDRPPHCPRCDRLETECVCPEPDIPPPNRVPPQKQTARLAIEKRAKGKRVTIIRGLQEADNDLPALLTQLKTACGTGGKLEGSDLELQGEHLERLRSLLSEIGYKVKG